MTPFAMAIDGMHCEKCVRRVQAELDKVPGLTIDELTVDVVRGSLAGAVLADVIAAVARAGYVARPG